MSRIISIPPLSAVLQVDNTTLDNQPIYFDTAKQKYIKYDPITLDWVFRTDDRIWFQAINFILHQAPLVEMGGIGSVILLNAATSIKIPFGIPVFFDHPANINYLKWNNVSSYFEFNNAVYINGKLTVTGAIDPTELDMPDNAPIYLNTLKTKFLAYDSVKVKIVSNTDFEVGATMKVNSYQDMLPIGAPAGVAGRFYYDSLANKMYYYNGVVWVDMSGGAVPDLQTVCNVGNSSTTTILLAIQNAVTPSYSFIGDTNTGIFSYGADNLGFATGGTGAVSLTNAELRLYRSDFVLEGNKIYFEATKTQNLFWNGTNFEFNNSVRFDSFIQNQGIAAPTVSPAGTGRIYYDTASNKFKASENGGAYVNLIAGTPTLEQVCTAGNSTTKKILQDVNSQRNVVIGNTGYDANQGFDNVVLGYAAFNTSSNPLSNVAIGRSAMSANGSGQANVAVGAYALQNYNSGSGGSHVAVGYQALKMCSTGSTNTALGRDAGYSITTNGGCVFLGYQAGYSNTAANNLFIANSSTAYPLLGGDFSTYIATTSDGTTTVNKRLQVTNFTVAPSNIGVGASPFVYQNTTGYPCSVIVSGGTVTDISFSHDNVTYYTVGLLAGMIELSQNDYTKVTYTVAPTMTLVPR